MQQSGTQNFLYGVSFTDVNNGTAVGISGTILRTTNGGTDWIPQSSIGGYFRSVSFTDENNGTIVGERSSSGIILKTTNGGMDWTF